LAILIIMIAASNIIDLTTDCDEPPVANNNNANHGNNGGRGRGPGGRRGGRGAGRNDGRGGGGGRGHGDAAARANGRFQRGHFRAFQDRLAYMSYMDYGEDDVFITPQQFFNRLMQIATMHNRVGGGERPQTACSEAAPGCVGRVRQRCNHCAFGAEDGDFVVCDNCAGPHLIRHIFPHCMPASVSSNLE